MFILTKNANTFVYYIKCNDLCIPRMDNPFNKYFYILIFSNLITLSTTYNCLPIALMILHSCCKGCETVAIFIQLRQKILLFPVGMISLQVAKATKCVLHFISHKKLSPIQQSFG